MSLSFKECLDQAESHLTPPTDDRSVLKAIALHLRALVIQQSTANLKLVMEHADHLLRHPLHTIPVFDFTLLPMPTGVMVRLRSALDLDHALANLKPLVAAGWTVHVRCGEECRPGDHGPRTASGHCTKCGVGPQ